MSLDNAQADTIFRELKRRLGLEKFFARLGDSDDENTSVVHEPGSPGYVRVRLENDDAPFRIVKSSTLGAHAVYPGSPVIVGYDAYGELAVEQADHGGVLQSGENPLQLNKGDNRVGGFQQTDGFLPLWCGAVATANTPSLKVVVNSFRFVDSDNAVHWFEASQIDLSAEVPAAGYHCYTALFIREDATIQVLSSTAVELGVPLSDVDKQEIYNARDDFTIPIWMWYLSDAQTTITNADKVEDLRPWLASPGASSGQITRPAFNGTFAEFFNALVTSDGATITMSLEQSGGGDLTMLFSDGSTPLDCTPALTIELTAGTVASPQENYIYIPFSTKVLTKSTSQWPSEEHIAVGFYFVQTAAYVAADGALINQNWNDELADAVLQGHWTHLGKRIRRFGASYFSGVDGTGGDDYTTSAAGSVTVQCSSGVISQLHDHTYSAKDTSATDDMHIVNAEAALGAYYQTQNLYDIDNDSTGGTLNNKYFNIVLWGVANKGGEYSPLMVNIPDGSYNTLAAAQSDSNGYDVFVMPRQFTLDAGVGFLIARLTFRKTGGTWVYQSTVDLRGQTPTTATGGTAGGIVTNFSDNQFTIFNNADNTKVIDVDASGITTVNTRTIIMADADVDLADIATNTTAIALNTTHRTSDGSDHTFIDQTVISGASPTFTGTNFTGIPDSALITDYVEVAGDDMSGTLRIDVATATDRALILKTTDDSTSNRLIDIWDSSENSIGGWRADGTVGIGTPPAGTQLIVDQGTGAVTTNVALFRGDKTEGIVAIQIQNTGTAHVDSNTQFSMRLQRTGGVGTVFQFKSSYNDIAAADLNSLTEFLQSATDRGGSGTSFAARMAINGSDVGIGTTTPSAKLHIDQHDTDGNLPVLYLDQADLGEAMIEFNTTIGSGNPIEAVGATTFTPTHYIGIVIPGALTRYIECGTRA